MSKIHILNYIDRYTIRVVIHINMPAGNNAAGNPWKEVALNSGTTGKTILTSNGGLMPPNLFGVIDLSTMAKH